MAGKIRAMIKEPGEGWELREIDNTLKCLQMLVDGYIETVTVRDDLVLIVNEEGVLQELEPNMYACGHWLRGTIVAVGVQGEDFADCPISKPWMMRMAIGIENARRAKT